MLDDVSPPERRTADRLQSAVDDLFLVEDVTLGLSNEPETIRFRGHLQVESEQAYPKIAAQFRRLGYTAFLRNDVDHDRQVLLARPGVMPQENQQRLWLNALLYGLTILSTLYVGASWSDQLPPDAGLLWPLTHLWLGWPFALSLMTILTGHELGHYFAGRYYRVPVSLPYFIPFPIPPLGTMGAFIVMKGRSVNRRQMLTVGAAGPLVGFVLAVPILILGLSMSTIIPLNPADLEAGIFMEGNSLLYLLLKFAIFGQILPGSGAPLTTMGVLGETGAALIGTFPVDRGYDVLISPVAMAGWAGILVTALNLLPVGQLDGGHVLYSLVGPRARILTWPIIAILLLMGIFLWPGWLLWAMLVFFFGQAHPGPLDDVTRLDTPRVLVAVAVLVIFVLTFTPLPMRIVGGETPDLASGEGICSLLPLGLVAGVAGWLAWRKRTRHGEFAPENAAVTDSHG